MLMSIACILLLGMMMGWLCKKVHLPGLLGMLVTGIVLGPYALNLIDVSILNISSELRKIALIIILARAGLSLNLEDLKKVGRPAILMCFVPACFEILGMILLAPRLLGVSILDAAIMGTVVGAVSPAVIVPKMLKLMEENYGTGKSIPQLILAGASVDDVFVIVLFTAFTGLAQGNAISVKSFVNIPVSIGLGIVVGMTVGYLMAKFFEKVHIRDTAKVMIFLCVSFILVTLEDQLADVIPFASLIAVMAVGITLRKKRKRVAERLSVKFNKLWVVSEIMLFVLVGATVNIKYALSAGFAAVILIFGVLAFRMVQEGADILHDRIYAESDCSGGHWRDSACHGAFLWEYRSDSGSCVDSYYSSSGRVSDRSDLSKIVEPVGYIFGRKADILVK